MKVLTANRLIDGEVVWYAAERRWIETIDGAEIVDDQAAEQRLDLEARAAMADNIVVDANLIDVEMVDGAIRPIRLRERIRAAGPTIHPDLGKQARPGFSPVA